MLCQARDLSRDGIGIIVREPMTVGAGAVVQVARKNRRAWIGACVRHCRYLGDGRHVVGLAFGRVPEGVRLKDLMDEHRRVRCAEMVLGA